MNCRQHRQHTELPFLDPKSKTYLLLCLRCRICSLLYLPALSAQALQAAQAVLLRSLKALLCSSQLLSGCLQLASLLCIALLSLLHSSRRGLVS